ncbi:MAG TPA: hypothetical protein VMJ32_05325 [Pirellulales bacterium]|nr:hypothetical protein [Pirellulales bacterium]
MLRGLNLIVMLAYMATVGRWPAAFADEPLAVDRLAAVAPAHIDVAHAPAPLYDDPVWHGATDPYVIWMPGKGENHQGQWWMYYTQRRSTLENPHGVDWVHGSAIGIATSADGLHWKYAGVCQGDHHLADPVAANISWWAPCLLWDGGRLHMFVVLVHGIFTSWTGDRTIEHFTSNDGVNWQFVSTLKLSSMRCIDPMVLKIGDLWYIWYKDEAAGSHTWMAHSPDLNDWTVDKEVVGGHGHEAPFVWYWKGAYWLIVDAGRSLPVYRSESGTDHWVLNNTLLSGTEGKRPQDNRVGKHPAIVLQGDQCLIYYFTESNRRSVIQLAELTLDGDGKIQCDRNQYLATTPAPPQP